MKEPQWGLDPGNRGIMASKMNQQETREVWIENCTDYNSNFSSEKGTFKMTPQGEVGSIVSIDEKLQRDNYVTRAIQRKKIRVLSDEDAEQRMLMLVEPSNEAEHQHKELLKYLGEGASDIIDRYQKKLPEEAEPSKPRMSPEQIFGVVPASQAASSSTLAREAQQRVVIEPVLGKGVLKPKMFEGDLPEVPTI